MNKQSQLDARLDRLTAIARDLPAQSACEELKKALFGSHNAVIARGARLIARAGERDLIPTLIDAFTHLLHLPAASDKGCRAKGAIIEALNNLTGVSGTKWSIAERSSETGTV